MFGMQRFLCIQSAARVRLGASLRWLARVASVGLIGSIGAGMWAQSPTPAAAPTTASAEKAPAVAAAALVPGKFVDTTEASGVPFQGVAAHTSKKYLIETMGSGAAVLDYDNDGLLDIFLVNGAPITDPTAKGTIPQKAGPQDWNRLYHQKKDGTFEDVTERAGLKGVGYGMGVAGGDYDK